MKTTEVSDSESDGLVENSEFFNHLRPDLKEINARLEKASAEERVQWALEQFPGHVVLSSSFGVQAAVSLHLAVTIQPDIPVVLVDTGYLFPETYRFIDELTERLRLNLRVYQSKLSAAWLEARHGKLWEHGREGLDQYNRMMKVEPMNRALNELEAHAWIAGLRRGQSSTRRELTVLAISGKRLKVHPIIDWTDRDVYLYLKKHDLPYHPLWHDGYISIGDVHTTHKITPDMDQEAARFFGLKRECGLHDDVKTDFVI